MSVQISSVPVAGGELRVAVWGEQGPLVVAAHGITSSSKAWGLVGPQLGTDHRFIAVDLRGRGESRDLPPPYGMDAHAADIASVIRAYGDGPAIVVGHSMGGFVAVRTARRYPDLVSRLVLVDGGAPLPLPPGVDATAGAADIERAINATVGVAFARLSMSFTDREQHRQLWRAHPSLVEWSQAIDDYVDYDLVGEAPQLRVPCRWEAALRDAKDLYALPGIEPSALPCPATFLRAERGMLDEPDRPLYVAGAAGHWLPGISESTVDGVNHYTITLGPYGADAVVNAVRSA